MLVAMAALMFASAWHDSITFDEEPHIAAGYTYLRKADYRFNPEHPPLMKDLAAVPLLFMDLRPPWDDKSWTEDPYGQWDFGAKLIFNSGASADAITRAAKAPMILFTVAFGWILFWWTRRQFGEHTALLTLFLYVLSPSFLAHGRLVTTDVGGAVGYFIAIITFLNWLKTPRASIAVLAGCAMGFALLTKFSTIGLFPITLLLATVWGYLRRERGSRFRSLNRWIARTFGVIAVAMAVVFAVYLCHTWNYPPERQRADAEFIRTSYELGGTTRDIAIWASDKPALRPLAQYTLGVLAVLRRSKVGNSPFFLGEILPTGDPLYFPFAYLIKEPLAFHLLTLIALAFAISRVRLHLLTREWLEKHFVKFSFLIVIAIYWATSMQSHLNIGERHIMPVLPFTYVLVADQITLLYRRLMDVRSQLPIRAFRTFVGLLLMWQAVSVLRVHPSYLAYFNESVGGPSGGWRYLSDSNIDWGQDLKRLGQFVEKNKIPKIALDYFGSADPAYYLKDKYGPISKCSEPQGGWIAVSAMWYADSRRTPECDYRRWLPETKITAKIGYSIFVFREPTVP